MKNKTPFVPDTQAGNIMIYILGAIVLLGVLLVVSKSNFTPGAGIDAEKTALSFQQVQRFGAELERSIATIIHNGHSETDIRFAHPTGDTAYSAYGDITSTPTRQVFSPSGGAAEWRDAPKGIQTSASPWVFSGRNQIPDVGTTCGQPACADLVLILPDVTRAFCLLVNSRSGIENTGGNPPVDTGTFDIANRFTDGTFAYAGDIGAAYNSTKGEGCVAGAGTPAAGTYHYYRVLLAR